MVKGLSKPIRRGFDRANSLSSHLFFNETMTSVNVDQQQTHQIGDAFRKVHDLVNIPLSEDVPAIQAANFSVLYQVKYG